VNIVSFALELVLPVLREAREMRIALLGLLLVAAGEENIDEMIERLDFAADLDVTKLDKRQREFARRIAKYAEGAAHDLRQIKEKL
jgi:hypothetical protein